MSHEVETMAYAGETPWHGLGVSVSNDLSPQEMLVAAGLDWEVKKKPLYFNTQSKYVKTTSKQLLARVRPGQPDEELDIVGSGWQPVQNAEGAEFFDEYVREGGMQMHTAGSLRNGTIVWFLAKIMDGFEAVPNDLIESYMLFTIPHIYGRPTDVRHTPIRVVCKNTMAQALNKGRSNQIVKVSHRNKFDPNIVKEHLGLAKARLNEYKEHATFLAGKKLDTESASEFFATVFPRTSDAKGTGGVSKQHDRAMSILETQPGAEFAMGTWWQAFNAVTFICDHEMGKDATRLDNAWYGVNANRKLKAMNLALDMAGKAASNKVLLAA